MADSSAIEHELCVLNGCRVFKLPPRPPTGYKAEEWGSNLIWTGTCKVISRGETGCIRLEDPVTGEKFAETPISGDGVGTSGIVQPVTDSSRFFVLKVVEDGNSAFIGIGFDERTQAFDFNVAISDFRTQSQRITAAKEPYVAKHDFALPTDGGKIKISLAGKLKAAKK